MNLKKGIKLIEESEGTGNYVQRQRYYIVAIRLTLNRGEIVKIPAQCLSHSIEQYLKVHDDGFFNATGLPADRSGPTAPCSLQVHDLLLRGDASGLAVPTHTGG